MDYEETMVEQEDLAEADDTPVDGLVEDEDESEESLDSLIDGEEEDPAEEESSQPQGTGEEPGWFKRRWDREVRKLSEQIRNEIRGEYEGQLAPMRERLLEMDAKELVKSGEFKTLERAKEYLQLKQGIQVQTPPPQPRNESGQYESRPDPATEARIEMLQHQRERIIQETGKDPADLFNSDDDIKDAIIAGEMDFYDVAKQMRQRKRPPSPTRSPNGVNGQFKGTIMSMTDEQFEKLEKRVKGGASFRE